MVLDETGNVMRVFRPQGSADFHQTGYLFQFVLGQFPVAAFCREVEDVVSLADFFHQSSHARLDFGQLVEGQLTVLGLDYDFFIQLESRGDWIPFVDSFQLGVKS